MSGENTTRMQPILGRVRGLGSAKHGAAQWWAERLTGAALVPLSIWFIASLIALAGADYASVVSWLKAPFNAVMMVLFLVATFHHAQLGLQVVLEDYVHREGIRIASILAVKAAALLFGLLGVVAVLKISIGG